MKKSKYTLAAEELIRAQDRIAAADLKMKATMAELLLGPRENSGGDTRSRPCLNVTPPKTPKK